MKSLSAPLGERDLAGVDFGKARELIVSAYDGAKLNMAAESSRVWAILADILNGGAETEEDFFLLAWARQVCYRLAEREESERWLLRAEQIWHLKRGRKAVVRTQKLEDGKGGFYDIVMDEEERPLWQWGSGAEDWAMFCRDELGMTPEHARVLERVWGLMSVQRNLPRERILARGKSKQVVALSVLEKDWEAGKVDEDLEAILDEGTWHETNEHVRERRGKLPAAYREPLKYDGEDITFWDEAGNPLEFGRLVLYDPLEDLSAADRVLWRRKMGTLNRAAGLKEE